MKPLQPTGETWTISGQGGETNRPGKTHPIEKTGGKRGCPRNVFLWVSGYSYASMQDKTAASIHGQVPKHERPGIMREACVRHVHRLHWSRTRV